MVPFTSKWNIQSWTFYNVISFNHRGTQDEGIIVDEQKNEEKRESVLDISEKKVVAVNREIERSIGESKEIERKSISLEGQDDLKFPLRSETGESSSLKENLSQAQEEVNIKDADTEDDMDRLSFQSKKKMWEQATLERRDKKKSNVRAPDLLKDVLDAEDDVVHNENYQKLVRDTAVWSTNRISEIKFCK